MHCRNTLISGRIIQIADDWYSEVTSALPVERDNMELLVEYLAQRAEQGVA